MRPDFSLNSSWRSYRAIHQLPAEHNQLVSRGEAGAAADQRTQAARRGSSDLLVISLEAAVKGGV